MKKIKRKRLPRYFDTSLLVLCYDKNKAKGQKLLHTLHKGSLNDQMLIDVAWIDTNCTRCILVSNKMIFYLKKRKVNLGTHPSNWNAEWECSISRLRGTTVVSGQHKLLISFYDESWILVQKKNSV